MAGKSLQELDIWKPPNIRILGVRRGTSTMTLPPAEMQICAGDHLLIWTSDADLRIFRPLATGENGKGGGPQASRDPVDDPGVFPA